MEFTCKTYSIASLLRVNVFLKHSGFSSENLPNSLSGRKTSTHLRYAVSVSGVKTLRHVDVSWNISLKHLQEAAMCLPQRTLASVSFYRASFKSDPNVRQFQTYPQCYHIQFFEKHSAESCWKLLWAADGNWAGTIFLVVTNFSF